MKVKPILFNSDMVRAILGGRKTQTRRVVKPQPTEAHEWRGWVIEASDRKKKGCASWSIGSKGIFGTGVYAKPPANAGDLLWVREAWTTRQGLDDVAPRDISPKQSIGYLADADEGPWLGRGRPSIHMPRWASRLTLEVTSLRVERLQDVSESDAKAEGWAERPDRSSDPRVHIDAARDWFSDLWHSLYGSWKDNPWVWVIEFKAHQCNVDSLGPTAAKSD